MNETTCKKNLRKYWRPKMLFFNFGHIRACSQQSQEEVLWYPHLTDRQHWSRSSVTCSRSHRAAKRGRSRVQSQAIWVHWPCALLTTDSEISASFPSLIAMLGSSFRRGEWGLLHKTHFRVASWKPEGTLVKLYISGNSMKRLRAMRATQSCVNPWKVGAQECFGSPH